VKEKSYSQRSCCNSENPFPSETTTCPAPPPTETLPPTTAPTVSNGKNISRSELIELIGIIVGAVGIIVGVVTVYNGCFVSTSENDINGTSVASS